MVKANDPTQTIQQISFAYYCKGSSTDIQIQSLNIDDMTNIPGPMPLQTLGMLWNNTLSNLTGTMQSSISVLSSYAYSTAVTNTVGQSYSESISSKIKIPQVSLLFCHRTLAILNCAYDVLNFLSCSSPSHPIPLATLGQRATKVSTHRHLLKPIRSNQAY